MEENQQVSNQAAAKIAMRQEYIKCAVDPAHFMRKYCMIQHPVKGTIPFNLYEFQGKVLYLLQNNKYSLILKSRQLGISTLSAGYALWLMIFNNDKNVLVLATKQETAKNMVTKVKFMYDNLPAWLRGNKKPQEANKLTLKLANGSQIKAVSAAGDSGRSEAVSLLIIDEAAFIDGVEEIWASSQQTLSTGGGAIVLSTPNGIGNWFHQMWEKAELSENNFLPIRLRWDVHPDRDISWRKQQDEDLGPKLAGQECDCDFLASGDTAFDTDDLEYYEKNVIQPISKRGQEGNLWIFEEPDYSRDYMVVADVARGDGKDYSACHVIDIESMKQVAEYKAHIQTPDYANFLYALATEYNDAMLVVENSSIGWDVITRLLERGYKNFYYSPKSDILTQEEWVARYNNPNNFTPGFVNSLKSRPLVIEKFREYVSKRQVIINSPRLVSEMRTFIWKNGRAEAQSGYNDDLVMSMAIGLYLRDTAVRFRKANLDLTKNALDNFSVNRGYTDQNAQQTDGGFGIYSGTSMNENSVLQQYKDNSWLF